MARNFAVSDLHGNYPLWNKVKEQLQSDDKLFFLGDATDRGLRGWDILKEALLDERVCYIRGNHDQFILDAWKENWDNADLWFYNGGIATYQAIMEDSVLEVEKILKKLNESPLCIEFNHRVYLSHAGWTFNGVLPSAEQLLWDRNHIGDETQFPKDIYMVHGHTPTKSLYWYEAYDVQLNSSRTVGRYCGGHKICIDGSSAFSNKCALLDLDTLEEIVIDF